MNRLVERRELVGSGGEKARAGPGGQRRYETTNWREYNAALKARGSLLVWLDRDMQWEAAANGKCGAQPKFTDAAIQFCLTIKTLFGLLLLLRQASGMVESLLTLADVHWPVPNFSTISRRQAKLQVQIGYRPSTALELQVDSAGVKMLGEGEWKRRQHGADYRRQWLKVHQGIDAQTLEIRAIEVTDCSAGNAPVLLQQISEDEPIASVSADGAYDAQGCHEAIAARTAAAVIPTRKNARDWSRRTAGALARNAILRATRRLGCSIWKKWSGYHRRSLVESKMRCFKLLGERVGARTFDRQVVELQVRAALLNRFTRLGRPQTVAVA